MIRLLLLHAPQGYLDPADRSEPESYPLVQAALGASPRAVELLLKETNDHQFVVQLLDGIQRSLQTRSVFDQRRYGPVIQRLNAWLQETPATGDHALPLGSRRALEVPHQASVDAQSLRAPSKRVFRPSHSLTGARMRLS